MQNLVGHQLGKYRLIKLLGRGGFAHVYLGEHVLLGTQAAIKVLSTIITDTEAETFLSEARNIASLEHPHITRVLDFDVTEDGTPFLVMEYAPNGSLAEHRPAGIALPRIIVVSYIKQVASALQYAHDRKKMIHRDVKPANMLLRSNNEVVLSDFGIAMIAQSSQNRSGQQNPVGTIHYMAPEQIQGNPCLASDQYALGIVAYEWLSGDRPFQGSQIEIGSQHMLAQPPNLVGKVPSNVEQVVMRALTKDPKKRFPSIQDFADALEHAYQEAQKVTHSLSSLHPLPGEEEGTNSNVVRDVLPIAPNPFEESWTTATALVSHYRQVIENYYQSVNSYEQAEKELQHDFTLEQQTIREAWVNSYAHAEAITRQVQQALDTAQRQLKGRWHKLTREVTSPVPSYGSAGTAKDLEHYQSVAVNASRSITELIKQYRKPMQISYRNIVTIGVLLCLVIWIIVAVAKFPGFIFSLLIITGVIVYRLMTRHNYTNYVTKELRQHYARLLQISDLVDVTYQKHCVSLQQSYRSARNISQKCYDRSIATIENDLEEKIVKLHTVLAICAQEADLLVAE